MTKLFFTCKRAKKINDANGNPRYIVNLFEFNSRKGLLLNRNGFLAGRFRNTKEGYIIKSTNIKEELQAYLKEHKILEVV